MNGQDVNQSLHGRPKCTRWCEVDERDSAEGKDFSEFYKKFFESLEGERLLKKVFEIE